MPARHPALPAAGAGRPYRRHWALVTALFASRPRVLAAGGATGGRVILTGLQRFFLTCSGVFALVALTPTVMAGLIATDRLVITPAGRVILQTVNRALSLAAVDWSCGACVSVVALALVIRVVVLTRGRTDVVLHPVPGQVAQGLPAALFATGQPGALFPVDPPPHRAVPGGTHYGTAPYGIVDDGMPRASGMP